MLQILFLSLSMWYPIDPLYMNNLCDESDFIVDATVLQTKKIKNEHKLHGIAEFKVNSILKGNLKESSIDIIYSPGLICPQGPSFHIGKRVIAYIKSRNGTYHITGLSYGTKYFKEAWGYEDYISRLKKYLEITSSDKIDSLRIVDWLIENLDHKTTRTESLFIINQSIRNDEHLKKFGDSRDGFIKDNVFPISNVWNKKQKDIVRKKIIDKHIEDRWISYNLLCHLYDENQEDLEKLMMSLIPTYLEKEYHHGIYKIISTVEFKEKELTTMKKQLQALIPKRSNYKEIADFGAQIYQKYNSN